MNILDKIKKNWNHKESVEKNVIRFSNEQEQRQRRIKKWYPLFIGLFIIACLVFPINPLVGICLMIGAITFGSEYVFNAATTFNLSIATIDSTHFVVAYSDAGNSGYGTAIIGTITNGNEISYGSEYVFNSGDVYKICVSLVDSTHFVVAYCDAGNSGYGTAIIGTITNGNEISYGSEYVFSTAYTGGISVSIVDSTHFVIACSDNTNDNQRAIIGTIANGDEISYGSEYVFNSKRSINLSVATIDSTHFVVAYSDAGNSGYGTAIIGTITNGNEISYGSEYVFNSAYAAGINILTIDSTHFIVVYQEASSNYGTAIIGTITNGDEISYGSEYVFNSASTGNIIVSKINNTKIIISFREAASPYYGKVIIGDISNGNEISFGDEYTFNENVSYDVYNSMIDSTHFVVAYRDGGNSNYGTAIIGTIEAPSAFIPRTMWF